MRLKPGVVCIDPGMRLKIRLVEGQVRHASCEVLRYDSWGQRACRGLGEALFWVMCYDLAETTKDIQILYVFIFLIMPTGPI